MSPITLKEGLIRKRARSQKTAEEQGSLRRLLRKCVVFRRFDGSSGNLSYKLLYHQHDLFTCRFPYGGALAPSPEHYLVAWWVLTVWLFPA